MYDETIGLSFCEIENNQGLGKTSVIGLGSFITLTVHCTSALIIPHITRIISNNNIAQYKCSLQALGPCTNYKRTL